MIQLKKLIVLLLVIVVQSCSSSKNKVFWVSGLQTKCVNIEQDCTSCLQVYKGEKLVYNQWEHINQSIENFEFEEGVLQKIKVKKSKTTPNAYTLIEILERKIDERNNLIGTWILAKKHTFPINRSISLPVLEFMVQDLKINGTSGCNKYFGRIDKLTNSTIEFDNIASTKKYCLLKNIEQEYYNLLSKVKTYKVKNQQLYFYDSSNTEVLMFVQDKAKLVNEITDGVYKGVVPCADCSGIQKELVLHKNNTYTLKLTYLGSKDKAEIVKQGTFVLQGDVLKLLGGKEIMLYKVEKGFLEQLDSLGKRIVTKLNYKLIKV